MTTVARPDIQRLDQLVADAIAAGEVVERPASVVKELCENALDAGARRIDVDIDGGGLVRIVVADDGVGIAAGQIDLAVARHATSKISSIDDLGALKTLGFRGEALASITAVSDVVIMSTTSGARSGARSHIRAGEVLESGPDGRAGGTTIDVRDLFFNTPARLRFLRTERAEAAAAARVVSDLALTHPDVAFTCRVDGRSSLRSPGTGLHAAAAAVFGAGAARELRDIAGTDEIVVTGCISEPRAHRGSRTGLVLVVNGRRVHNRALGIAVDEAYRGVVPAGRHAYGVVCVELDAADVDANVHPAKREVRFHNEGAVFSAVQRACWHALQGAAVFNAAITWNPLSERSELTRGAAADVLLELADAGSDATRRVDVGSDAADAEAAVGPLASTGGDTEAVAGLAGLTSLGQVGTEWLVAWSPGRVVLVDPHAAHEKVLYEEILARWHRGTLDPANSEHIQLLLIPAVVECDAAQMEALEANAAWLEPCGFMIEPFGPGVVRCNAVPAASADADVGRLVTEILDALGPRGEASDERRHRVAALIACHSAVRFGDRIDSAQQQALLGRLALTTGGMTCPHGRPTVLVLDDAMLRRAFRRPPG